MSKPANAFDPDRDPFDPEREGWTGWERVSGRAWIAATMDWCAFPYLVQDISGAWVPGTNVQRLDRGRWRQLYDAALIPHTTVVSILVANGYVPE